MLRHVGNFCNDRWLYRIRQCEMWHMWHSICAIKVKYAGRHCLWPHLLPSPFSDLWPLTSLISSSIRPLFLTLFKDCVSSVCFLYSVTLDVYFWTVPWKVCWKADGLFVWRVYKSIFMKWLSTITENLTIMRSSSSPQYLMWGLSYAGIQRWGMDGWY